MDRQFGVGILSLRHQHAKRQWLDFLVWMPEVKLLAVADSDPELVKSFSTKYKVDGYTDPEKMLARTDIDVVFVLGEHRDLPSLAIMALEAGKHVLVEKPGGVSLPELKRAVVRAQELNLKLSVPYVWRYLMTVQEAKRLLREGKIGDLAYIHLRLIVGSLAQFIDWGAEWALNPERSGGGCMRFLGCHLADLSLFLCEDEPESIYAEMNNRCYGGDVEDNAITLIRMTSGATCVIECGFSYPQGISAQDIEFTVRGSNGVAKFSEDEISIITNRGEAWTSMNTNFKHISVPGRPEGTVEAYKGGPGRRMLQEFLLSIDEDTIPSISPEDALKALAIVEGAYESAKLRRPIYWHDIFQEE